MLSEKDGEQLLKIARKAILSSFSTTPLIVDDKLKEKFSEKKGVFVRLLKNGSIEGYTGFLEPFAPLWEVVVRSAENAAFNDPTTLPLKREDIDDVKVEISIIDELKELTDHEKIIIGKHGLYVKSVIAKASLLPQIFEEQNADAKKAIEIVCERAGLNEEECKEAEFFTFTAQIIKE